MNMVVWKYCSHSLLKVALHWKSCEAGLEEAFAEEERTSKHCLPVPLITAAADLVILGN